MFVFFLYSGKNAALDTINVQYMMSHTYMKIETKTGTEGRSLGHVNVLKLEFKFPVLELTYGRRSLSRQAPEVKQCTSFPDTEPCSLVWWENINLTFWTPNPSQCISGTLATKYGKNDGFLADGSIAKPLKLCLSLCSQMKVEEQVPETIKQFSGQGNKHWRKTIACQTDDQEIKTSDDETLCPNGIYLWLFKEKE